MKSFLPFVSAAVLSLALVPFAGAAESAPTPSAKSHAQVTVNHEAVNINTADVQTLTRLKGIGPKKAEAIIAWRETNGNFKTVDQLLDVKGIGEATLVAIRDNVRI